MREEDHERELSDMRLALLAQTGPEKAPHPPRPGQREAAERASHHPALARDSDWPGAGQSPGSQRSGPATITVTACNATPAVTACNALLTPREQPLLTPRPAGAETTELAGERAAMDDLRRQIAALKTPAPPAPAPPAPAPPAPAPPAPAQPCAGAPGPTPPRIRVDSA